MVAAVIVLNENVRRFGQFVTPGGVGTAARLALYAGVIYLGLLSVNTGGRFFCYHFGAETQAGQAFQLAAVFFLVYLVYLLIYYPGVMYWDTMRQIADFFDGYTTGPYFAVPETTISAWLNDHDGAFDTILFGLFISFGNLFRSPNLGMFLYCVIQAALFALLFAHIIGVMRENGCPRWLTTAATVFFLHPFVCYYAIMMLKDVLFALCFLPYFLAFVRVTRGEADRKTLVRLVVFSLLCALTKKPGVYIVVLSNLVLLAKTVLAGKKPAQVITKEPSPCYQSDNKRTVPVLSPVLSAVVLPALVVLVLFPKVVFPALQIYPGGKEEVLAVCLQTTAVLVTEYEDTLTEEDKQIIDRVMHYDRLAESYLPHTADWPKYWFRLDAPASDVAAYLKFWVRKGFRHPLVYLRTVCALNGGFFSPTEALEIYISANPVTDDINYPGMGNLKATLTLREDLERLYGILSETPPFSFFFQNVLYTWIIPACTAILMIAQNRKRDLVCLVPVLMSVLVLIAGPESTTRFATHLIFLAPFIAGLALDGTVPEQKDGAEADEIMTEAKAAAV
ncbi:MAG: hypothetical protein II868_00100 [Butyrivibrio sp.]|nr:hypothetical protein [Butyrivibrio sp.]